MTQERSIGYEGPTTDQQEKPAQDVPTTEPAKTYKIGDFEFNCAKVDPSTGTVSLASLLNTMLVALASSEDLNIRRVLNQANLEVRDIHDKIYFPRVGE